jgi:hypothetical protein
MATKEQEAQEQIKQENERQAAHSYRFLQRNPRYKNTDSNNGMLAAYLTEHRMEWTVENLEEALSELEGSLDMLKTAAEVESRKNKDVKEPVKESPYPWQFPLTPQYVASLTGQQFLKFMEGSEGAAFKKQIAELKLKRS